MKFKGVLSFEVGLNNFQLALYVYYRVIYISAKLVIIK